VNNNANCVLVSYYAFDCFQGTSNAEFQHPCRDRNDSHTLMQCTVNSIYWSACVIIYIFHICTHDHAYSDRLQT